MFERAATHDLEAQGGLLGEDNCARVEEHLDSVPGFEAAAEAEHELVSGPRVARPEAVWRDGVGHHLDALRLDTFRFEPPPQHLRNSEDPAGAAEDPLLDLSSQVRMRKRPEPARLLAKRRVHLEQVRN